MSTTPARSAALDAIHVALYRARRPHHRYIVVWRPRGSIVWSQSQVSLTGCPVPIAMLYATRLAADHRARQLRKTLTTIARPTPHSVLLDARVIRVNLPR